MRHAPVVFASVLLFSSAAFAQFPPPGVYSCVRATGEQIGELNLFVAGDYSFKNADGNSASGQLASAGNSINPLSGPLREMGLTGTFGVDEAGAATLLFSGNDGLEVTCR